MKQVLIGSIFIIGFWSCDQLPEAPKLIEFNYENRAGLIKDNPDFKNVSEIKHEWSGDTLFLTHLLFVRNTCVEWILESEYDNEAIELRFSEKGNNTCELATLIEFQATILFSENDSQKKVIYSGKELSR